MSESFYREIAEPFASLELFASQVVEGFITGLHRSPFHGFSVEFAEHRQYNPGESVRHIDWKLYGRTDRLYIKKFQEETNLRCHIFIDTSSSMFFPMEGTGVHKLNKVGFSVCAAACLATLLVRQRDAVGLRFFSDRNPLASEVKSTPSHLKHLLGELERRWETSRQKPPLGVGSDIVETLHVAAEQIHKRSLVILFSDMFDGESEPEALFDALQHLRYHENEVILFHVSDKKHEEGLGFSTRHCCFVDMESGREVKLSPAQYRQAYGERYRAYLRELEDRCAQYHIDFVEADIAGGFVPVLQAYLAKRQKIFK